ncbi:hypothetical protein SAMN05660649_00359 [Desulfotomaculum arcticum]|uniref:DUF2892 domain-containing protein n=1 Tax=Desulfotruncus arcticus DSM 17038 TaxID=1121424 RepID=A0A1I2N6T0_9FIRM|nr:hypothetical protein SAMN05660649_00359 [Desulfotomaculum arcticum] [Desulfotruncus arcticus DSM 17038]
MFGKYRWLLRLIGLAIIAVALLGNLPGAWPIGIGIVGLVVFFLAGPT